MPTARPLHDPTPSLGPAATPRPTSFPAPRFVGQTMDTAQAVADRMGLLLEEERRQTDEAPPGNIIEQVPGVGERVRPGATIRVVVAQEADTVAVPDVHGETEENARADLVAAGLLPGGRFRAYHASVPEGLVIRTDPRAGTQVALNTSVAYYLSRGPRPAPTPTAAPSPVLVGNYRCVDLDHARAQILDAGMTLGAVTPSAPQSDGSWVVQDQDPAAGAEVQPGTRVRLQLIDPAEPCS